MSTLRIRRPGRLAAEATALLVAAAVAFPLYWMVLSAFKPAGEIQSTEPRPWTLSPSLDSFRRVFEQQDFGRYFLNSLIVACTVVLASALIAFLAATAVTRFRFRFRTTLLIMFLVAQMVPIEALTIPLFFLMRDVGQLNTLGSLILPHIAFSLPFAIWMLRGFVKAVPEALEEQAAIDGASRTRFLWQILFPLVFPGSWRPASSRSSRPGTTSCSRSRSSSATPRSPPSRWRCSSSSSPTRTTGEASWPDRP